MEENRRFTLSSTKEQTLIPKPPKETGGTERPSISTEIENTRTSAQAHLHNINLLLESNVSRPTQVEELIIAKIKTTESWIIKVDSKIEQIDLRLLELNQAKGFRRIPAFFKKKELKFQKQTFQDEIDDLKMSERDERGQLTQLQEQEKHVSEKREELLCEGISQEVQSIKEGYEQLLQEILKDKTIPNEIMESYIKRVISPKVEKTIIEKKLPEDKREEFYQTLKDCVDHKHIPKRELQPFKDKLYHLKICENGFSKIADDCRLLMDGRHEDMIKRLVITLAADDITQLITVPKPHYDSEREPTNKVSTTLIKAIGLALGYNEHSYFGGEILSALARKNNENYPDMDFWQAVKDSPLTSQVFGEVIKRQDQEYYQSALDNSLVDNKNIHIDLLQYYPTPNAIRNLVVLASAAYRPYRTDHANHALIALAKRTDWGTILDEAEKTYPSLKEVREILQSWSYCDDKKEPNVREVVSCFALDIFEGKPANERLIALATESLNTDSLLTISERRGFLTEQEMSTIKEANKFLGGLPNSYPYNLISIKKFRDELNQSLFILFKQDFKTTEEQRSSVTILRYFDSLSKAILENKTNPPVLKYLTEKAVIKRIKDPSFKTEMLVTFLEAYKTCPALLTYKNIANNEFLVEFCKQFEDKQTVIFFNDMSIAYQNQNKQLNEILVLIRNGRLTKERALEIPAKTQEVLSNQLSIAIEFPKLFLETEEGLDFFKKIINGASLFSLDKEVGVNICKRISILQMNGQFSDLLARILPHEILEIDKMLASDTPIEVNQQNWQYFLAGYAISQMEPWEGLPKLSKISTNKINALFGDPRVRDTCLNGLRNSWIKYLKSGKPEEIPFSLTLMSEFINYCGGIGPLSQIESLNSLINDVSKAFSREMMAKRTKLEICQGILSMEERFAKEKWSKEGRTDFYNISRDILKASPSLFSDYLTLFKKLSPSQMKLFAKDIYQLHRTKLVLMEKKDKKGHGTFDKRELIWIRKDIRDLAKVFNIDDKSFENHKKKILKDIINIFKDRFGIIKIPQEFSSEKTISLTNVLNYLANLSRRTADKETFLGFYLSIMINDHWDEFKRGEIIDPSEYLTSEKSSIIDKFLQERQKLNPLTPECLGIPKEEMPDFLRLLQQETQNIIVGNIETIDIKLMNIIINLRGLEDLDLYPNPIDKQKMQLLLDHGSKQVNSVVSNMYKSLKTPGGIHFSKKEIEIQQKITQVIQQLDLSLTPQTLKEHFQDGIKPLAIVINLLNFIEDTRAEVEIERLRDLLKPSEDVIQIFRRLGENFKPTSGAMALSQDLNYLDNLIVKRETELDPKEKTLLTEYIANIREQIIILEEIYGQVKDKFGSFKKVNANQINPLIQGKLDQIDRIINSQATQQTLTSTITNNLNTIIENIRECLSCTKQGLNNDTNLTFGDTNKLYILSQSENQQKGSISDQIVFVEPITRADGSKGIAFVLDRIYGTNTPEILGNQIEVVLKKYRTIKQRFPDIRLSVFIPDTIIATGGISTAMMQEGLKTKNVKAVIEKVEVDVAESATGDHYIEFGGSCRIAGVRQVDGIVVTN